MHTIRFTATVAALSLGIGSAHAQHSGDIALSIDGGQIATAALAGGSTLPSRVFGSTFGDTGVARFTSNPGFEALPGTFAAGTRAGFNALSGLYRFDGPGALAPVGDERLEIKFLTLVRTIANDPLAGFDLAVGSDGGWHRHLSFRLFSAGAKLAPTGIYAVELEFYSTDGVTLPSEPFWLVFNDGRPEAEHDAAIQWIVDNMVGGGMNCPADLDGSGLVDASDLASMLAAWGGPDADLDGDGLTTAADLATLLVAWGPCE